MRGPAVNLMMDYQESHGERRRHLRFSVALPVNVHVSGRAEPVTVDMIDIGAKGVRFRLASVTAKEVGVLSEVGEVGVLGELREPGAASASQRRIALDQQAAFGFVVAGQQVCVASGRVTRIVGHAAGQEEFVLSIERANDAFQGFLVSLSPLAH
jgi:hypothetical protein